MKDKFETGLIILLVSSSVGMIVTFAFTFFVVDPVDNWFKTKLAPILTCDQITKLLNSNTDKAVNLSFLKSSHKECFNQ